MKFVLVLFLLFLVSCSNFFYMRGDRPIKVTSVSEYSDGVVLVEGYGIDNDGNKRYVKLRFRDNEKFYVGDSLWICKRPAGTLSME